MRSLLTRSVTTGAGPGSVSEYTYDVTSHPNLLQERHWDSTLAPSQPASLNSTNSVITYYGYDGYGNRTLVQNARLFITGFKYDSNNCMYQKLQAQGTTSQRTFNYTCEFYSGLNTTETDSDHNITRTFDYDAFGRNTLVTETGGGLTRKKPTTYYDETRQITFKSDLNISGDGALISNTRYDQLGRVRQTSDPAGNIVQRRFYTPPSGQYFGYSYMVSSNPYVTGSEPTRGWHLTTFDRNARTVSLQHFSGSALPSPWSDGNSSSSGTVSTSYSSNATTVTDESTTVTRVSYQDGLGRLRKVTESNILAVNEQSQAPRMITTRWATRRV